jgi:hypothetical protein
MGNTLVDPFAFDEYQGGPFSPEIVDAAVAYVRMQAGWHIAPVVAETFTVDAPAGPHLFLPTMQLVSVTAVRLLTDTTGVGQTVTNWYPYPTQQFKSGRVTHRWSWPWYGILQVDVTHGYSRCPDDLLPVIAQVALEFKRNRAVGQVRQESVGSVSASYNPGSLAAFTTLGQYMIPAV